MINSNSKKKYQVEGDKSFEWKYHVLQHFKVKASRLKWILDY